jgi:putative ABC transport system permease protein
MGTIISLALKNVWRYRRRTILTFLVLSVGLALYIFMTALFEGLNNNTVKSYVDFETGHFRITSESFNEDDPFSVSNFISRPEATAPVFAREKVILAATSRIHFPAEADNTVDSMPCVVTGFEPERDSRVFSLTNFISKGSFRSASDNDAIIGAGLAKDLGVGPGDAFYLTLRNAQGMIDSISLNVKAIVDAPDPLVNASGVYITLSAAQKYLNIRSVSEIALRVKDPDKDLYILPSLASGLKPLGLKAESWHTLSQDILALSQTKQKFTSLLIFFLVIIALVGIANTMLMSVFEKTREIGMLKALGMRDSEVQSMFIFEGLTVGVLGGIVGVLIGVLSTAAFMAHGMDFGSMMGKNLDISSLRMSLVIYPKLGPSPVITSLFVSIGVSLLASWAPARRTRSMLAAECLRTV